MSGVVETAAIAVTPLGGGPDRLVVCVVHESPLDADTEQLKKAFSTAIRSRLNPLFKVHDVTLVEALPRTASNKVMRRVLRAQYKQ